MAEMIRNSQLDLARKIIESTGCSLFLTGKAGTGKTTFLRELRAASHKRMIVAAPTGIAAINAGGVTLHSFFQLDFGPFVPGIQRKQGRNARSLPFSKEKIKIIRGLDLLVIDEISMVRADVLDAVDDVLRRFRDRTQPFGGVQLLLIGDLQQLPPVVPEPEKAVLASNYASSYFFDSHALSELDYLTIELTEVFRQTDSEFINILNAVRDNSIDDAMLRKLNSRHIKDFNPEDEEGYVRLTTHNKLANAINRKNLDSLRSPSHFFQAEIEGKFPETSYPAEQELELKEGARVMFIKNDTGSERRYFNGMLGTVTAIDGDGVIVTPDDGNYPVSVEPAEWQNVKYVVEEESDGVKEHVEGTFRQLPLKTAWAITIHKSQGLTFDRAIIDASMAFAHGQAYVAFSRCRTLQGMVLDRPISRSAIITDLSVTNFLRNHLASSPDDELVQSMTHAFFMHLAAEMFNFRPIFNMVEGVARILRENFSRLYPKMVLEFSDTMERLRKEMVDVGDRFRQQLARIDADHSHADGNTQLLQRIKDGSAYFSERIDELWSVISSLQPASDNKKVIRKLDERIEMLRDNAGIKKSLFTTFSQEDFSVERYLDVKAAGIFGNNRLSVVRTRVAEPVRSQFSDDNVNPALFDDLCRWRKEKAGELGVPAYTIARTKTLLAISNCVPTTFEELAYLPGIGSSTIKNYGDDMLRVVSRYRENNEEELTRLPIPHLRKRRRH